jgi:hypothetical protein
MRRQRLSAEGAAFELCASPFGFEGRPTCSQRAADQTGVTATIQPRNRRRERPSDFRRARRPGSPRRPPTVPSLALPRRPLTSRQSAQQSPAQGGQNRRSTLEKQDHERSRLAGRGACRAFGCPELRDRRRKHGVGSGRSRGWCGERGSDRLLRRGGGVGDWSSGRGAAGTLGQFLRRRSVWFQFHPEDLGLVVHDDVAVGPERDPTPVAVRQFLQRIQQDVWKVPYPLGRGLLGHLTSNGGGARSGRIQCKAEPAQLRLRVRR